MIREAAIRDADRIAEIDVTSSRYAYRNILSDECLYKDLTVENRIPVHRRWIAEKRFGIYVYEDSGTGIIQGMMGIGPSEDEDKKGAYELHFLYVDPDCVRKGESVLKCCGSLNKRAGKRAAAGLLSGLWRKTKWEGSFMRKTASFRMEKKKYSNDGTSGKSDM